MYQHPRTLTKSGEKHILENRVQFIKAFVELETHRYIIFNEIKKSNKF